MKIIHIIGLLLLFYVPNFFSQKRIEHNFKIGLDFNFVVYGANDAIGDPLLRSLNIGYTYSRFNKNEKIRFEFGAQMITYGSQFRWTYSFGSSSSETVLVRFRYTAINFPALIGIQKNEFYACFGPGISCPVYYSNPHPAAIYQTEANYRFLVPFVSLMFNCGRQLVLLHHKFSFEFQSSLFHYSKSTSFRTSFVGYLNAGFALKFNFVKEKNKTGI